MEELIVRVRSGGQSGVDRGALDAARAVGVGIAGWCPSGGWAEDLPVPPGLLIDYPELTPTPSDDVNQRTEWNVRDSHATLILRRPDDFPSKGTDFTIGCAGAYGRPYFVAIDHTVEEVWGWLTQFGAGLTVNVAGPRESEAPGAYQRSRDFVEALLRVSAQLSFY